MKSILFLFLWCMAGLCAIAQGSSIKVTKVAVMVYPGVELLDFAGPADVFEKAAGLTGGGYEVYVVSLDGKPVATQNNGPRVAADYSVTAAPRADILVIPGADMDHVDSLSSSRAFMDMLAGQSRLSRVTLSVCTGAYLLAGTGRLDGRRSTTHFFVSDDFAGRFPDTRLVRDVRYVDEDSVVTTSGVTSGIDGALHLVKKISGDRIGDMVARGIQYYPHEQEVWPKSTMSYKGRVRKEMPGTCIVCGMRYDKKYHRDYKGKTYWFCSAMCLRKFCTAPDRYLGK